jgi:hypothetical protein
LTKTDFILLNIIPFEIAISISIKLNFLYKHYKVYKTPYNLQNIRYGA